MIRFEPGETIAGRYVIEGLLARGGMASVYVARMRLARGVERRVALKRVHPHLAEDAEFVAMFVDEARLASQLRHPGVIPVYDALELEGELILVLEYVPGWDLSAIIDAGGSIAPPIAARIAHACATTLAYVHDASDDEGRPLDVVHRDVTPSNILLAADGTVRLLDFGVAKAARRATRTATRTLKGKLAYMAPEQARGEAVEGRTDVYAVGLTLFEMLTGTRFNDARHDAEAIERARHPSDRPPIPDVPTALLEVLDQLLATSLVDRPTAARAEALLAPFADADGPQRELVENVMGASARALAAPRGQSAVDEALAALLDDDGGGARGTARSLLDGALGRAGGGLGGNDGALAETVRATPVEKSEALPERETDERREGSPAGRAPNEPPPDSAHESGRSGRGWPARTAAAVLVGIASVAALAWAVAGSRGGTEEVRPETAPATRTSATPGFVVVSSDPPGAAIEVDGAASDRRTPSVLTLTEPTRIGLVLEDHARLEERVVPVPGEQVEWSGQLERLPGSLTVESEPAGARVTLDGEEVGLTPWQRDDLPRRLLTLRLSLAGRRSIQREVDLEAEREQTVRVSMLRVRSARLAVGCDVNRTRVEVDGETVSNTCPWEGPVSAGSHRLRVVSATGRSETRRVQVAAGERTVAAFYLR